MLTKEGANSIVIFMTPGAGFLVLRIDHSKQTESLVMMTYEGSNKIVIFVAVNVTVKISHIVKIHYFFNTLLYSLVYIRQSEYIVK